jgi:hypothetical protein
MTLVKFGLPFPFNMLRDLVLIVFFGGAVKNILLALSDVSLFQWAVTSVPGLATFLLTFLVEMDKSTLIGSLGFSLLVSIGLIFYIVRRNRVFVQEVNVVSNVSECDQGSKGIVSRNSRIKIGTYESEGQNQALNIDGGSFSAKKMKVRK